jgi:hypothetical protein
MGGVAVLVGAALAERIGQLEKDYIARHGGDIGKAISNAVEKVCVVCGTKSHRLDWQLQDHPACDSHLQSEHDAAKSAMTADGQKATAQAEATGIQASVADNKAKQLAGPEKPSGVSVQTPAAAAQARTATAQKPASPTDVAAKPASLQATPPAVPASQTKPLAPAPASPSPAPQPSADSPTAKKITTDATQPIQPAAPAGEPDKKA